MEKIKNCVWGRYMNVDGSSFPFWFEGLSPIEQYVFKSILSELETTTY